MPNPTDDPQGRAARLAQVLDLFQRSAPPEDRDLLQAFAPVIYAEMPDRLVFALSLEELAGRLRDHFRFVVREMPPAHQLYRGLPGIHVVVRNPDEAEAAATGGRMFGPHETTIVETHSPDAPFIFESLKNYFQKAGLRVFAAIHPILTVRRQWERIVWIGGPHDDGSRELFCQFRIERVDSRERLRRIEHEVFSVLKTVFTAVEDFGDMRRTTQEVMARLKSPSGNAAEADSARAFLGWLLEENYIFIGMMKYRIGPDGLPDRINESSLGVFTDPGLLPVVFPGLLEEQEAHIRPAPGDRRIIDIDYCNNASAIHHLEPIDDIVVREWDEKGNLVEATLLLGRFAKVAFTQKASDVSILRDKHDWLLRSCGSGPNSHAYREIRALFNRYPKRELFYADAGSLKAVTDRIVHLTGDDEIVVHARNGAGYVALTIAFSRLRYSYKVEEGLTAALASEFGPISFHTAADLGAVTLLVFYFDTAQLEQPMDEEAARRITGPLVTTWEDRVADVLMDRFGEREGTRLFKRYIRDESRSGLYRESTPPAEVPDDLVRLENLEGRLELRLLPRAADAVVLKLYSVKALGLTETLRTLSNLGLTATEELRIPISLPDHRKGFLYRFELEAPAERIAALLSGEDRFSQALRALDEGHATDDALNGLVLDAGLTWREVEVLRTLRNHLLQIRPHYNAETVNGVLLRNAPVAAALVRLFTARFDPRATGDRDAAAAVAVGEVRRALESVKSLSEDEVLRALDNLIRACLRTNFFQLPQRPVVSIKVDSRKVDLMPSPRPMFEIYVHSRLLEGIHLRGGKVARGGIRWSDRHDDFRTEVLGLMKTQMVKNSIIVPVGSKGGFLLKGNVPPRPALDGYLIDRYREYVSGLLDVTDNIVDGHVLHPPEVVRHDGDDPYLVVAADKGTAHLSDTANGVSAQYGFWLGDAFASGGSVGYDHKKVGITARGAWECVKHHFKLLGHDVQTQPFTVAGIGDLSGDVFGNGLLMSRATRLVAAFNHMHIFVDPDPDPARSYQERERMFRLPRSTWRDYDATLISAGGGIFDRHAKAIPVSPQMKALLDVDADEVSGDELVRRILTARVDLLYNGGIGTYVKSAAEEDADVGDRANDRIRIDGGELRARVVSEGGNLGFTQRGRLEYWAKGGLVNTDAADNSAGVDMSDHEVNIKILMDLLVKRKVVGSREERNRILAEMTDEVADLVLADNENQSWALTLDGLRSAARYEDFVAYVEDMIGAGHLNRQDDAVPTQAELLASPQRQRGLPRPLLAVVLGHTKMWAFEMLLETGFPDGPGAAPLLSGYFPVRLRESFGSHFGDHALRREIVATVAVNHIVNNAGVTFLSTTMKASEQGLGEVVAAYLDADRESGASALRERVRSSSLPASTQAELQLEIEAVLEGATRALLQGQRSNLAGALDGVRARL